MISPGIIAPMFSCILLAAGLSRRFQSPKALAQINSETVIERLQQMLLNTNINEIIIVLGYAQEMIQPHLLKHIRIKVVYNKDYNLGQTSSFKVGLASISENSQGTFLLPVDYPFIRTETIEILMKEVSVQATPILIPTYKGKKGHPPYFASSLFQEFIKLDNNEGINTISHRYQDQVELMEVNDPGVIKTFNTLEELEAIKE